jgi:hypothetical protein
VRIPSPKWLRTAHVSKGLGALVVIVIRVRRIDSTADTLLAELALLTVYTVARHVRETIH